jgi:hypothetical protein
MLQVWWYEVAGFLRPSPPSFHNPTFSLLSLLPTPSDFPNPLSRHHTIHNSMQNVQAAADQVAAITGYTFTNELLCAEATQMASPQVQASFEGQWRVIENNKRLAILGDAILAKALCATWFQTRKSHSEIMSLTNIHLQALTIFSGSPFSQLLDDHAQRGSDQRWISLPRVRTRHRPMHLRARRDVQQIAQDGGYDA